MIKYVILALVAISSLQLVLGEDDAKATPGSTGANIRHKTIYEKKSYKFEMRERLGHFSKPPFVEVYKHYSFAFNRAKNPTGDLDDYRNFVVTANECRNFLAKFLAKNMKLANLESLIVLDGCLGYIFAVREVESDDDDQEVTKKAFLEIDPDSSDDTKKLLKKYSENADLQALFDSKLNELGPAEKTCIADLLFSQITARVQFPQIKCNNHMLQLYLQFAECQENLPALKEAKETDPYVKLVYDLVKSTVRMCYHEEIKHIDNQMTHEASKQMSYKVIPTNSLPKAYAKGKKRNWSKNVVKLLLAIQNLDANKHLVLREAAKIVSSCSRGDELTYHRLLVNMGEYATRRLKPRNHGDEKGPINNYGYDNYGGEKSYRGMVDNLCRPFRSSDKKGQYDYALSLIRLVRLLKYKDVFGIRNDEFLSDVMKNAYESGATYIAVSACNILTFTEGEITENDGILHYVVRFKDNVHKMINWPQPSDI